MRRPNGRLTQVKEAPRDPATAYDAGGPKALTQNLADLPHADDDERGEERVADDWNPEGPADRPARHKKAAPAWSRNRSARRT
jgi:hypothetical protein